MWMGANLHNALNFVNRREFMKRSTLLAAAAGKGPVVGQNWAVSVQEIVR